MTSNALKKTEVSGADDAAAPVESTDLFVAARALEILREWMETVEIDGLEEEAARVVEAGGSLK